MPDLERDELIESIASELRRPVRFDADFDARVMAALESPVIALRPPGRAGRSWLLRPRTFSISPLAGLAAAAALIGIITFGVLRGGDTPAEATQLALADTNAILQNVSNAGELAESVPATPFIYVDSTAVAVTIVGDFNDWDIAATPLKRIEREGGTWMATVALPSGRHEYQLVIDGHKWVSDPAAQQRVPSAFGGENSVVTVGRGIR